ncbi:hypothetical protein WDZ92_49875, partial [Nostoc sp. NIES-2111]
GASVGKKGGPGTGAGRPSPGFSGTAGSPGGPLATRPDLRLEPLLTAYMAEADGAARQEAAAALMQVAAQDMPALPLAFPKAVYGVAATVEMPPTAHGRLDFPSLRPRRT